MIIHNGINAALISTAKDLKENGVWRNVRGTRCLEFPHPYIVAINNPQNMNVIIPERKWNYILPYAESLWIALGWNVLEDLPGFYVKNLYTFSDDGETWRGGYGSRIRKYTGTTKQYREGKYETTNENEVIVDQLKFVIESIQRDRYTRQAIINIGDPMKDCFDFNNDYDFRNGTLLSTKDFPCTRSLHFMVSPDDKLNMYVTIRSNDILWGMSAVNIPNFCIMQQYVAAILGLKVGTYYHIAHNLHIYENFYSMLEQLASLDYHEYSVIDESLSINNDYFWSLKSLEEFDSIVKELETNEKHFRTTTEFTDRCVTAFPDNPFFYDWNLIFAKKNALRRKLYDNNIFRYRFYSNSLNHIFSKIKQ